MFLYLCLGSDDSLVYMEDMVFILWINTKWIMHFYTCVYDLMIHLLCSLGWFTCYMEKWILLCGSIQNGVYTTCACMEDSPFYILVLYSCFFLLDHNIDRFYIHVRFLDHNIDQCFIHTLTSGTPDVEEESLLRRRRRRLEPDRIDWNTDRPGPDRTKKENYCHFKCG